MIRIKTGRDDAARRRLAHVVVPRAADSGGSHSSVRYVDSSDGEDLTRYGTECAARSSLKGVGIRAAGNDSMLRLQELEAFHDGFMDVETNDQTKHLAMAASLFNVKQALYRRATNIPRDWTELWDKLRDAPYNRRALLRAVEAPQAPLNSLSCMEPLPPHGFAHVLKVGRKSTGMHTGTVARRTTRGLHAIPSGHATWY